MRSTVKKMTNFKTCLKQTAKISSDLDLLSAQGKEIVPLNWMNVGQ